MSTWKHAVLREVQDGEYPPNVVGVRDGHMTEISWRKLHLLGDCGKVKEA